MTVTEIRREGKFFALYSGERRLFAIDARTLEESGIKAGAVASAAELNALWRRSEYRLAREKALGCVARRELCRKQLIDALEKADFSEEACEKAADEMEKLGFIDDERFADTLAEYIYRTKRYGRRRVVAELCGKGINRSTAEEYAEKNEPDVAEALDGLLETRLGRQLDDAAGIRRVMGNLYRFGYESGDVREAIARKKAAEE